MNPLLFADWSHIHRVFRGLMWILATVLVFVVFFAVSSRAVGAHGHPASRAAGELVASGH